MLSGHIEYRSLRFLHVLLRNSLEPEPRPLTNPSWFKIAVLDDFFLFFYQIYLSVISPYCFLSVAISFWSEDVACSHAVEFELVSI